MRSMILPIGVAVIAVALLAAGCGNGGDAGSGPATLTIADSAFSDVTVEPGGPVEVTNEDGFRHTVTADDGSFDVAVDGGGSATFTAPAGAGTAAFHCEVHPTMTGQLNVEG